MGVTATISLISHQANTIRNRLRLRLGVMPGTKLALWPSGLLEVGDFHVVNLPLGDGLYRFIQYWMVYEGLPEDHEVPPVVLVFSVDQKCGFVGIMFGSWRIFRDLRYPEVICLVVKIHFTVHPFLFR